MICTFQNLSQIWHEKHLLFRQYEEVESLCQLDVQTPTHKYFGHLLDAYANPKIIHFQQKLEKWYLKYLSFDVIYNM